MSPIQWGTEMVLELYAGFLRNIDCAFNILLPFLGVGEMNLMVAIGAQSLQIAEFIVFSVFVSMVYNKIIYIILATQITFYYSMFFYGFSKSFRHIIKSPSSTSRFCRAILSAKSFFSALKFYPASNHNATFLTWMSLNACQRTIFLILSKAVRSKRFFACFANYLFFSPIFIRATSRTAQLLYAFSQIFKRKRRFAYNAILHNCAFKWRMS